VPFQWEEGNFDPLSSYISAFIDSVSMTTCMCQAVEFINNLKAERSGKKIDVELIEGELADDVRYVSRLLTYLSMPPHPPR